MIAQTIVVSVIIAIAGIFIVHAVYRTLRGKDACACHCAHGCSCDRCGSSVINRDI
jgi:hypothetical protein